METHKVPAADKGLRLDKFLRNSLPDISRSRLQALIKAGAVFCNGKKILEPAYRVIPGEIFCMEMPAPEPPEPLPENIPLAIKYEDHHVVVVNKPAGMVVHPGAGNRDGTLVNALIHHCKNDLSGIGGVRRPGIVHRLDKNTSGLLVIAKNDKAHNHLARQFADHGRSGPLERCYRAIVWGRPPRSGGTIVTGIGRKPHNRLKMAVLREGGREAVTHYRVIKDYKTACLVECRLETGRTHQIRVHMAHIGAPIIADLTYGPHYLSRLHGMPQEVRLAVDELGRQALHACVLGFEHPQSREHMRFTSRLPEDMQQICIALEKSAR
jgi:23S rRNA pseudouridine1911/1915/1917 synthase